jgi:hypothetical protein
MKIFTALTYSGENEFEKSFKSISVQDYDCATLTTFKGFAKKQAHDEMWSAFMKSGADLLIHVGADMVIYDSSLFSNIVTMFMANPWMQNLEFTVDDYFSDQMIWGLNVYHNIDWKQGSEQVFTDFVPVDEGCKVMAYGPPYAPVASHCESPGFFQSFHAGAHKALKLIESHKRCAASKFEYYQDIMQKTRRNYLKQKDVFRQLFMLGADFAIRNKLKPEHLDYTNPFLRSRFDELYTRKEL